MKLSDFVFQFLEKKGVCHVFTLTGGGIMHLVNSMGHSNMKYSCCHHEQAAAIAAQAYSMYNDQLSLCLVTTGPGGTNAITGAAAAYVDSTPVIYMTGQVKRSDFASIRGVRQFGAQENDIISMVKPITKYAVLINEPNDIQYELEKCVYIANLARKGPVWIDIPLDVQAAEIDPDKLRHFYPPKLMHSIENSLDDAIKYTCRLLEGAKRPIILVGYGMVSSKAVSLVRFFSRKFGIPLMATWRVLDIMSTDDKNFFGSPGLQAPRYSNLILQHSDVLIVLGSRLDNMITAFNEEHFAFRAKKVIVDIDEKEIAKLSMTNVYPVVSDVRVFMEILSKTIGLFPDYSVWLKKCQNLKERFSIFIENQDKEEFVNLYKVTKCISDLSNVDDTIVISSTSRCNTAGHIAFCHKEGQKTISSMGMGSMGFAIPSAVGAYYANGNKRVVVIEGDGSLQLNIQELQTVVGNNIDAKMFIFDNRGYAAITTMQDRNFDSFYVGSNEQSGLTMPDLGKIAYAYDIPYYEIAKDEDIKFIVERVMNTVGPVICKICGSLWFDEIPKCISLIDENTGKRVSALLENPYPFLSGSDMESISNFLLGGDHDEII